MTRKIVFCGALMLALVSSASTRAQAPGYGNGLPQPTPVPETIMEGQYGLSDWITYRRGGYAMGPIGRHGPIASEVYLRGGLNFPIGGNLSDILRTGFTVGGGGRALLFNQLEDAAWTIDVGVSNTQNHAEGDSVAFVITQPGAATTVNLTNLSRTTLNLGIGRQWYLWGSASDQDRKWVVGLDGGGRYGSASARFVQIRHRTDVIGGAFVGGYAGLEIPVGAGFLDVGVRGEFSYIWSDILQVHSDVSDIGVLFNVGLRF